MCSIVRVGRSNLRAALPHVTWKTLYHTFCVSGSKSDTIFASQFLFLIAYPLYCIKISVSDYLQISFFLKSMLSGFVTVHILRDLFLDTTSIR